MSTRFGRYELVRPLGRGGMAEVFLAVHRGPGGFEKRLVIKRVLPALAADEHFLRMFFDEAKLHAQLTHGSLVPIFDFGRVGNDYFLAMDYVEGRDLAALVDAHQTLTPDCIVLIGQELTRALAYVHRNGLIHRDVGPRNVLVSVDGEIKLADFGVARPTGQAGGVSGTIAYMSPEQARGESVDARSDLYSLGLVIAELVTGRRVRGADTDSAHALAAAASAPRLELEGPFGALVARATEPEPDKRYADAAEMGAAFDEIGRRLEMSRAGAVHRLAEVARRIDSERELHALPAEPGDAVKRPATYFRGAETQVSIVDAILERPPRSRRRTIVVLLSSIAAAAGVVLVLMRPSSAPPNITPSTAPRSSGDPVVTAIVDAAQPIEPTVAPVHVEPIRERPRPAPRPHAVAVEEGTVRVVCTPWCVVEIDGQHQGEDGRLHVLQVPAGHHRLVGRRLEDQRERAIDVPAAQTVTVELRFD